jgi:hypothetical protein
LTLLWWSLRDMNYCCFFPAALLPLLAVAMFRRVKTDPSDGSAAPQRASKLVIDKPVAFFTVLAFAQIIINALLAPQEVSSRTGAADIRYFVNLLPICAMLLGMILARIARWRIPVAVVIGLLLVFTNVLTLGWIQYAYARNDHSAEIQPAGVDAGSKSSAANQAAQADEPQGPPSQARVHFYIIEYCRELHNGYRTNVQQAADYLKTNCPPDSLVLVASPLHRDALVFYLSDRYRFCNVLREDDARILPKQRERARLPEYIYSFNIIPDEIVLFGSDAMVTIPLEIRRNLERRDIEYNRMISHIYFQDESRPELFWHSFDGRQPADTPVRFMVQFWRRK